MDIEQLDAFEAQAAGNAKALGVVAVLRLIGPRGNELAAKIDITDPENEELGLLSDILGMILQGALPLDDASRMMLDLQAQLGIPPINT